MRKILLRAAVTICATLTAAVGGTTIATAQPAPLPVPYNFIDGVVSGLTDPLGPPPGANDWTCKPSAQHPRPVVLVHGTGASGHLNWGTYAPLLKNVGYCVYAVNYGSLPNVPYPVNAVGGLAPIENSAAQVGAFVDRVLATTGAEKVDMVGHSQGTIVPGYYVKVLGGASKVAVLVSLGPAWGGSPFALADVTGTVGLPTSALDFARPLCAACLQADNDSEIMTRLKAGGPYADGPRYTNIASRYDFLAPPAAALIPGPNVTNIVLQDVCPADGAEHIGLASSPNAAALVLNALDPAHPRAVDCVPTQAVTGVPLR